MKIAFTTNGNIIEDSIEPAFGRCRNFIIVDSDSGDVAVVPNPGAGLAGGAGVKAAETLAGLGIDNLITGSLGPNAGPLLQAAGIAVVTGQSGKISAHLAAPHGGPGTPQPRPDKFGTGSVTTSGAARGRSPAGFCFCQNCGYRTDDDSGAPCFKLKCPACATPMERRYD
ncbi:MAG: NifB/NifX family molybdenum-iron cluster-binding protein [Desulfobacterales bacterium]